MVRGDRGQHGIKLADEELEREALDLLTTWWSPSGRVAGSSRRTCGKAGRRLAGK